MAEQFLCNRTERLFVERLQAHACSRGEGCGPFFPSPLSSFCGPSLENPGQGVRLSVPAAAGSGRSSPSGEVGDNLVIRESRKLLSDSQTPVAGPRTGWVS